MTERELWQLLSAIGALFYCWLIYYAIGDLWRRIRNRSPRSAKLLAWHRVALDAALVFVMALDVLLAWLSTMPGYGEWVVRGLILGKTVLVVLGVYLAWNRVESRRVGRLERRKSIAATQATPVEPSPDLWAVVEVLLDRIQTKPDVPLPIPAVAEILTSVVVPETVLQQILAVLQDPPPVPVNPEPQPVTIVDSPPVQVNVVATPTDTEPQKVTIVDSPPVQVSVVVAPATEEGIDTVKIETVDTPEKGTPDA